LSIYKRTSIAIDPEIWERFRHACRVRGLYQSHVMEKLIQGWLRNVNDDNYKTDVYEVEVD
jgi:hypothetical protein